MLDGERLSYRSLDVEQIGSVYESMMGFDVQTLPGRTIALKPKNIVIDLDELLAQPGKKRAAWLKEQGRPFSREASIAKVFTTERAFAACGRALGLAFQIATRRTSWVAVSAKATVDPRAAARRETATPARRPAPSAASATAAPACPTTCPPPSPSRCRTIASAGASP